jgi:uncharacterized protein
MNQTLYITGGTGFIGRSVVERFLNLGFFVYLQTRSPESKIDRDYLKHVNSPAKIDRKIDLLINLAGKPLATRWTEKSKTQIYQSRVTFTYSLFEAFSQIPEFAPTKVLSTSAIGYYRAGSEPHTENSAKGAGFSAKLCNDWEEAAQQFEKIGASVSVLRLGVVLDKEGGSLKAMLPSFKLCLGAKLGSGTQWFSWIGLEDLLRLYTYCFETDDLPPAINAVAPNPVTNEEFTRLLASALHRPALFRAPKFLLKAILGEGAEDFLLANLRVVPDFLSTKEFQFRNPDLASLFSENLP